MITVQTRRGKVQVSRIKGDSWGKWFLINIQIGYSSFFLLVRANDVSDAIEYICESKYKHQILLDKKTIEERILEYIPEVTQNEHRPVRDSFYRYLQEPGFHHEKWKEQKYFQEKWSALSKEERGAFERMSEEYCLNHGILELNQKGEYIETTDIHVDEVEPKNINFFQR